MPVAERKIAFEASFEVTCTIDGVDLGTFEGRTGGAGDTEDVKTRLGGLGPEVALGGLQTAENLTLKQLYDLDGNGQRVQWLYQRRGRGRCVCRQQPLDVDGNAYGEPLTWTGVLKGVKPPDVDHKSNDEAFLELEISTDGDVG